MLLANRPSLRGITLASGAGARFIADHEHRIAIQDLAQGGSALDEPASRFANRSVLIRTDEHLPAVLAALDLDGVAKRILLCPPDVAAEHLPAIVADAGVDDVITDGVLPTPPGLPTLGCSSTLAHTRLETARETDTEWVLFTSGTTGRPKLVRHTLASLTGPIADGIAPSGAVWSTFYDVRRYGGLQILLRALAGGGSMVLASAKEGITEFLLRCGSYGVTHISGTPSHWRRALMSAAIREMHPDYVRLSGEIADQAILDQLRAAFPKAGLAHAFASTEAGVAFDVRDGLAGFPTTLLGRQPGGAEIAVIEGTLRIRSMRTANGYLGAARLPSEDGFVDTGDMVEQRGDRFYFIGRRQGVINVGGVKVYPEEVEAVLNAHPAVLVSRVWSRQSPIVGAVVSADVVLAPGYAGTFSDAREALLRVCRDSLPPHKVPVSIREMTSLPIAGSGKLLRPSA